MLSAIIGLDNRWLLTVNSAEARDYLLHHGLSVFNKKIKTRRYDDVLKDEYAEYQYYEQMQNKLYATRRQDEMDDDGQPRATDSHKGPPSTPELPH